MINLQDLQVDKDGKTICSVPQLSVAPGERLAILGNNGSGKSTLLRVLAGLENDYTGQCRVDCEAIDRVLVQQAPFLFRGTVLSNVVYGLAARGLTGSQADEKAMEWIERLGLSEIAQQSTQHLSGGETRRVAIARGMVLDPKLLLLDEPLAEVDALGENAIRSVLENLPSDVAVVITCPNELPAGIATREFRLVADRA